MSTTRTDPVTTATEPHDEDDARAAATVLSVAASALRHSLDRVHAADDSAWEEYSRSLDEATSQLQAELIVAGARLDAQRAEQPEGVQQAMTTAGDALHEWLDTARVQAHLGRMDAGSSASRATADLERLTRELRDAGRRAAASAAHTVEEARHGAAVVLDDVLELVRVTVAAARSEDPSLRHEVTEGPRPDPTEGGD